MGYHTLKKVLECVKPFRYDIITERDRRDRQKDRMAISISIPPVSIAVLTRDKNVNDGTGVATAQNSETMIATAASIAWRRYKKKLRSANEDS